MLLSPFALLPLFLLAAPAGSQSTAIPTVTIAESSFRIAPATIHLVADQPVRLLFTNLSGGSHDFAAPEFFAHARILDGMTGHGAVDVPGHGQQVVTLIPGRGSYRARCTHFAHSMMGMKAVIVVE